MDRGEVAGELADAVKRQVQHLTERFALRAGQRDASVGSQRGRLVLKYMRKPGNVPRQEPVVVVKKQQKFTARLRQRLVGGLAAVQGNVCGNQPHLERTAVWRQGPMPRLCRNHHHFNAGVGLQGD